ncbi:protein YgfX [Endozoicomonas ascidiicola]|uniref:protein YgfX n=1 Tax=Endozoicomonas ascidiicola TaxID=1698521 RepID=UPI003451D2F6
MDDTRARLCKQPYKKTIKLCEVHLKPSRYRLLISLFSHIAAMIALWLSSLSFLTAFLLTLLIMVLMVWGYRRYLCLNQAHSLSAIRLFDNQWRVRIGGQWLRAWPKGDAVVTSFLICFRLQPEGNRRSCYLVLFPDSADPIELHAFRLRLLLDGPVLFSGKHENSPEPTRYP